jgi:hypothetical protein
MVLLAPL